MTWTTFHLTIDTPLFSGDNLDNPSPGLVRVPSLRGTLRFWFRAIAAGHGTTDLDTLARDETAVFGNAGTPSRIRLRIDRQPEETGKHTRPTWTATRGMSYLLGQGLWSYKTGLTRPHVPTGKTVQVKVAFSGDPLIDSRFLLSLWAMLAYGGLGARTRRGFGRLRCTDITGALPAGWQPTDLRTHDWKSLTNDPLPEHLRRTVDQDWPGYIVDSADTAFPHMSTLAPRWWGGTLLGHSGHSFDKALGPAGQSWRSFRLGNHPDQDPRQDDKSPEWLCAIHGGDNRYPIAALGLPVNYYSRTTNTAVDVQPTSAAGETIRRASPVWLVPARQASGRWDIFTHVFFARLLPDGATLGTTRSVVKELRIPSEEMSEQAWDRWLYQEKRIQPDFYSR